MHHRALALSLISILPIGAARAATTTDLKCNVQSTYTQSTGYVERNEGVALLEITESEDHVWIIVSSDIPVVNDTTVSSVPGESGTRTWVGENFSTANKWDVTFESKGKTANRAAVYTRIVVDRISGTLVISKTFENNKGSTTTSVSGSCEKPSGKRKF